MKKIVLMVLIAYVLSYGASVKRIQSASSGFSTGDIVKVGYTSSVTAGNLIAVSLSWGVLAGDIVLDSIKDKQGNKFTIVSGSYISIAGPGAPRTLYIRSVIAYDTALSSDVDTVTAYFSASDRMAEMSIYELTPGALDQYSTGSNANGNIPVATTITTATDSSSAISCGIMDNNYGFNSGWFAEGSGWDFVYEGGGGGINALAKYLLKTPAGDVVDTATSNYPGITGPWVASMATFKPSGAAAPTFGYSGGGLRDTVGDIDTLPLLVNGQYDSVHIIHAPIGATTRNDTMFLPRNYVYTMFDSVSLWVDGSSVDTVVIPDTTVWDTIKIDSLIHWSGSRYDNFDTIRTGDTVGIKARGLRNAKSIGLPTGFDSLELTDTAVWTVITSLVGDSSDTIIPVLADTVLPDTSSDSLYYSGDYPATLYSIDTTGNKTGNGSWTISPGVSGLESGTKVYFVATPDAGWQFGSWSGSDSLTTDSDSLTITGNLTIGVTFGIVPIIDSIRWKRFPTSIRDSVVKQAVRPLDTLYCYGSFTLGDSLKLRLNSTGSVSAQIIASEVGRITAIVPAGVSGWMSSWVRGGDMISGVPKRHATLVVRPGGL